MIIICKKTQDDITNLQLTTGVKNTVITKHKDIFIINFDYNGVRYTDHTLREDKICSWMQYRVSQVLFEKETNKNENIT